MAKKNHRNGRRGAGTPCNAMQIASSAKNAQSSLTEAPPSQIASQALPGLARILRPQAASRWMMPSIASYTPQAVENILRGALTGDHVRQWELFDLMFDSWPELAACQQELTEAVMALDAKFEPYADEDEPATPTAIERQKLVSAALRRMQPDICADENDLEDTLKDILDGWFRGVVCLENDWHRIEAGKLGAIIGPRATFFAHPDNFMWSNSGRLSLKLDGALTEFPPHKFLVGIHKAKSGSALGGATLRPLAWWWCAANFASDWLLNLAQIFGLPFRWANHDPNASQETVNAICNMLQNMGSAGWAAFPAGTTLELKDAGKAGDASPQGDLLDRADRYARMLILGQTMSGSQDSSKGGGKAFGAVESKVKNARRDAAAKYVEKVINGQLIPSIIELNYGDRNECPEMCLEDEREAGADDASRDTQLAGLMPLSVPFLRRKYNLPEAGPGEESTDQHKAPAAPVIPPTVPGQDPNAPKDEDKEPQPDPEKADEDLAEKLSALCGLKDDALFAKQLQQLAATLV